jgi:hypothetical protein
MSLTLRKWGVIVCKETSKQEVVCSTLSWLQGENGTKIYWSRITYVKLVDKDLQKEKNIYGTVQYLRASWMRMSAAGCCFGQAL